MKKIWGKKALTLSMAGILLLTGCGVKEESPSVQETTEYIAEEPIGIVPKTDGSMSGQSGSAQEMTDASENGAEESPPTEAGAAAEAATEAADFSDVDSLYSESESDAYNNAGAFSEKQKLESGYDRSGGMADEWKMAEDYASVEREITDTTEEIGRTEPYYGGEEYSRWQEKGFSSVMAQPRSTFAADVDTASYSNLRRLIREGYGLDSLPEGAARIEEMLNYFSYDYNDPKGTEPFGVTTQISRCPWNKEAELLMIGLKTRDIDYSRAPVSNLVFLLDVSGSMDEPDKLPLLQESFARLTDNLTEKDRISIVTYAAEDKVVLQGAHGDEKRKIKKALAGLEAGGGTYGSKGIETAYALAEDYFIKNGNNRIILATDGDLNIGMTSEEELEELITKKKESGIFLSVLGFGTGNIKDNKMETLADKGNGNYAYIDCLREANKVLVEEMSATLLTICKDVKFQVEFNPDVVKGYRLLGYENRGLAKEDFDDDTKDGGEIGAGHSVTALYEIVLCEPLEEGLTKGEIQDLKYYDEYRKKIGNGESAACGKEWLTISLRYKKPVGNKSALLEYPIGYESYRAKPTEDFVFAAAVAEFGLLASHSAYPEDASLAHVKAAVRGLDFKDEYKTEFLELVQTVE